MVETIICNVNHLSQFGMCLNLIYLLWM